MTANDPPRRSGDDTLSHMSPVDPSEDLRSVLINRVSWGAVFAGVVVALVVHLILNMIGIGVGTATLNPAGGDNPSTGSFSIGTGIWWTVSGILASLGGGYAAGKLAGKPKKSTAGWHGLTSWAVTTLVIFYLLTSTIGGIVGGMFSTVSNALGSVTQAAVQSAAPSLGNATGPFGAIENQIRSATGGQDPAALQDNAVAAMRALLMGTPAEADQARNRAAQMLAQARQIPIEQARADVERYERQYRQTIEQAKQQADTAATAVSTGALFSALSLLLGAVAAWFGGRWGTINPTITAARPWR